MKKKNVLITGGAGFIGSNIARFYLEKGDSVWAIDNFQTGRKSNIDSLLSNPSFQFEEADLLTWPKIEEAVNWATKIYHMAACIGQYYIIAHPAETLSNNIHGSEILLKAVSKAASKPRLLIASTSEVYRNLLSNDLIENATLSHPSGKFIQESYPLSKLINETMALAYVHQYKVDCTIVRLFNTIGKNQSGTYGMVVPRFIEQALSNQPLTVFGDGLQSRSFSNVLDTISAMDLLLQNPASKGEIVNVGNEMECTILDLAKLIIERAKSKSTIQFVPYKEAYGIDFVDITQRRPNLEKLKRMTKFQPKWTLEATIDELIKR